MEILRIYGGVLLGFLCTIVGVLVGGLLVFKTKRGGYEPLFTPSTQESESAFNLDDPIEDVEDEPPPLPPVVEKWNRKFRGQYEEDKDDM